MREAWTVIKRPLIRGILLATATDAMVRVLFPDRWLASLVWAILALFWMGYLLYLFYDIWTIEREIKRIDNRNMQLEAFLEWRRQQRREEGG